VSNFLLRLVFSLPLAPSRCLLPLAGSVGCRGKVAGFECETPQARGRTSFLDRGLVSNLKHRLASTTDLTRPQPPCGVAFALGEQVRPHGSVLSRIADLPDGAWPALGADLVFFKELD